MSHMGEYVSTTDRKIMTQTEQDQQLAVIEYTILEIASYLQSNSSQ